MTDDPQDQNPPQSSQIEFQALPQPHIPWAVRRPGFWRCRRTIERLLRYQQLVIHHDKWASYADYEQPLEQVIGKERAQRSPETELERQMGRLALLVVRDMELAGVFHLVKIKARSGEERQLSLVADYLSFPDETRSDKFKVLMRRIEMAVGLYEERKHHALLDWFNPLFWIAYFLRMPIAILEYAGLITTTEHHSAWVKFYEWVGRIVFGFLVVICIAYVASWFGFAVPWNILGKILGLG